MLNLFNKGPKVRAGKQTNKEEKKQSLIAGLTGGKGPTSPNMLGEVWKKMQKMDRKQAYTWGAVAAVALVALISIASMGGPDEEDFSDFETRGYDLASMPFSTDEAEQYLLASKYPDMKDKAHVGLYSKSEKEERQAEDAAAEEQARLDAVSSQASEYRPGRYYGGGGGGAAASPTQVSKLNSTGLKGASGSGMKGTFGPQGDFSNFRSQERGSDKFTPKGPGSGDARKALLQTAQASRAAAGLKNDKLLNAKKAMMGGNVKGSGAFLDDSGAVNLGELKGLELDTNAPISSADLSGLDKGVEDANKDATKKDKEEEEVEWWQDMLRDVTKQLVSGLLSWGMDAAKDATYVAQAGRISEQEEMSEISAEIGAEQKAAFEAESSANEILGDSPTAPKKIVTRNTDSEGVTTETETTYYRDAEGDVWQKVKVGNDQATETNLSQNSRDMANKYTTLSANPTAEEMGNYITAGKESKRFTYDSNTNVVYNSKGEQVGTYDAKTRQFRFDQGKDGKDLRRGETLAQINKYNREQQKQVANANKERLNLAKNQGKNQAREQVYKNYAQRNRNRNRNQNTLETNGRRYSGSYSSDGNTFTTDTGEKCHREGDTWECR